MTASPYSAVTRLWDDATVVCLAGGPSLTQADVDSCRGRARVLAIKDTIRLCPDPDVLYACDARWWRYYGSSLLFAGPRYAMELLATPFARVLKNTGEIGLELQPDGLRTGRNSGYQAVNLAVHLGARRIVLLGYDMQPTGGRAHWFGSHPYPTAGLTAEHYKLWLRCFETIVAPLKALGVEVYNATRSTALRCFPCVPLEEALS